MSHWLVSLSASIACQVFGYRPDTNWHIASLFVGWWPNICILFLITLFPLFLLFLIPFLFYYNLHFSCFFASDFPFCCSFLFPSFLSLSLHSSFCPTFQSGQLPLLQYSANKWSWFRTLWVFQCYTQTFKSVTGEE